MKFTSLFMVVGASLLALAVAVFIRFWSVSGFESPTGVPGGQVSSGLDWATFFASPFIGAIGLGLIIWAHAQRTHSGGSQ